jgi:cysteinyl-tRNA synthetase
VYDYAHIGNFRAFITYDIIKRWLQYCGYEVNHVCNLTDVDDKIINKMLLEQRSLREITEKYTRAFFEDLDALNIIPARLYPKATEHISEIETMVDGLVQSQHAYVKRNSVYFRTASFPTYTEFARLKLKETRPGAGESGPHARRGQEDKESEQDFVLWKASTVEDAGVSWGSRFGSGRPGNPTRIRHYG